MMLDLLTQVHDTTAQAVTTIAPMFPNPGGGTAPPGSEKILLVLRWVAWICSGACVIGVMIAGASMALAQRGHGSGGEHAARLGWVLAGCIVIGMASGLVGALV